ncbi:MAG: cysteine desulfurase [Geminicoccaceae bacterium]|nr:cysteine desulfurase [Geminicoccaceae bacterium]
MSSAHDTTGVTRGMERMYFDFNATTPIAPEVAAAMQPLLGDAFGNPSSTHWAGRAGRLVLEAARSQVAEFIGAAPDEIVLTSGGSEASNLAIKGAFFAQRERSAHIVTTAIEHPATLAPCRFLERLGGSVTVLPVDSAGLVDPDDVRRAITVRTVLVTIMHANNEVGTLQPIAEIARVAREHGVLVHTDAAQSAGKIAVNVDELGVDLLSIAGHKFYAPKGIGALYVRRGVVLEPVIHGAGHEGGRRAGTESILLAAGLGAACALSLTEAGRQTIADLRDRLWSGLQASFGERVLLNGHPTRRLPNTLNVSFIGCIGANILARVPELAASTGSACHAGHVELSPVLRAMAIPPEAGMGAVRFSLGRTTTAGEVDRVLALLRERVSS